MRSKTLAWALLPSAMALCSLPSTSHSSELRIDGFANFVAGQMISDEGEGSMDINAGRDELDYDQDARFDNESLYGIQFRADLESDLSITAQIVGRGVDEYEAKVTWAYLSYAISDELTLRFGRSRVPYFMYSDFLDVGYAYHWVRTPNSVYNLGFENQDGLTLEYLTDIMGWTSRLTAIFGRSDTSAQFGDQTTEIKIINQFGGAWSLNYDWFTARLAYFRSKIEIDVDQLNALKAGVEAYDAGLAALPGYEAGGLDTGDIVYDKDDGQFFGLGLTADFYDYFAMAEYTVVKVIDSPLEERQSYYISGGMRFNEYTVYLTYENWNYNNQDDVVDDFEQKTQIAAGDPDREQILTGLKGAFYNAEDADSYSLGMRYDFHPSAALKVDYTFLEDHKTDNQPELLSVAVNVIF